MSKKFTYKEWIKFRRSLGYSLFQCFFRDIDYYFYKLWNIPYHKLRRIYWFFYNFFHLLFEALFKHTSGRRWFGLYCLLLKTFRRYEVYIEDEEHFPYDDWTIFPYWTRKAAVEDTKNYAYKKIYKTWWI